MTLYFEHATGKRTPVKKHVSGVDEALRLIAVDVAKRNPAYQIPYTRYWEGSEGIWFDVGSHTEFYILKEEET